MKRTKHWLVVAIIALAAMPATALAGDKDKDKSNAAKACRAERGNTDASREAFAKKYGTEKSGFKNAFGKCVSQHAKQRKHHKHHKADKQHKHDKAEKRHGDCHGKPA